MKLFLHLMRIIKPVKMTAGILILQNKLRSKGFGFTGSGKYEDYSFGAPTGRFCHPVYEGWYRQGDKWVRGLSTLPSSASQQSKIVGRITLSTPSTFGITELAYEFLQTIYNE